MTQTKEVQTSVGKWILKKPKAGVRNRAIEKAERNWGISNVSLMLTLLPVCIAERPESFDREVPIEQVLNDLEPDDYDTLALGLTDLIKTDADKEMEKKNES